MKRRADLDTQATAVPAARIVPSRADTSKQSALAQRPAGPHTPAEVEERYVAARDEWTRAMRAANSGRAADLASLALAQEAYELAAAERERRLSGAPVAIPIEPDPPSRHGLEAIVGNELAWRRVRTHHEPQGLLARMKRRIRGR